MRAVIQRVQYATLTIDHKSTRNIGKGLLVLLGIEHEDSSEDIEWLASKIARLRIFSDEEDKMNLSVQEIDGEAMVVSQFTLHASTKKGNRPSWIKAADPSKAEPMYRKFVTLLQGHMKKQIITGEFGTHMDIEMVNDGPVTIIMDSKRKD
nr:D-aminoacyl-tRNA deacylase [Bacteroidales bacterium]